MMAHLLDSLNSGQDIGHYGRLVFAMVARHFVDDDTLVETLRQDPACEEHEARALVEQVKGRDYSPPRREKVLDFQSRQDFPICPNADDPDACNVYKDLQFPESVYAHIGEYREQKAHAHTEEGDGAAAP
ncbi:MAG TPA: hypothetical protein VE153_04985 [Myxococcus sp.]|nr:hypothetical protein [Myxococcus sp.]